MAYTNQLEERRVRRAIAAAPNWARTAAHAWIALSLLGAVAGCGKDSATGPQPGRIEASPSRLEFGAVDVGSAQTMILTLRNAGGLQANIDPQVGTSASQEFSIVEGASSRSLAGGESHTVTVRFAPSGEGVRSGNIVINSQVSVAVSGTGRQTLSVFNAWWEQVGNADNDACRERGRLVWDADVTGSGSVSIRARVHYRSEGSSTWTLLTTTSCYTIIGNATADAYGVTMDNFPSGRFEFKVEIAACDGQPAVARGPSDDTDLDNVCFESRPICDTNPTYALYNAWWTNIVDADRDGKWESASLTWDADITNGDCTKSVQTEVYWRRPGSTAWTLLGRYPCYSITGNAASDLYRAGITLSGSGSACFEFMIRLFSCGSSTIVATRSPATDGDLGSKCFER